jgi:hypothetical protein
LRRAIGRRRKFRDDAFQVERAGLMKQGAAVVDDVMREEQRERVLRDQSLEQRLAFDQCRFA